MRSALFAFVLLLMTATPAEAFRCGNRIASEGDLADRILAICGEPTAARSWIEVQARPIFHDRRGRLGRHFHHTRGAWAPVEVVVEEWVYNRGTRRLTRVLRFENGYLVKISTTKYGYPAR